MGGDGDFGGGGARLGAMAEEFTPMEPQHFRPKRWVRWLQIISGTLVFMMGMSAFGAQNGNVLIGVAAVVNRFADRGVSSTMRIVLNAPPPVQEPPLPVRVELSADMPSDDADRLAAEISEVVSTELRFRCKVELLPKGSLEAFQATKNQKQQLFEHRYDT